MKQLFCIFSVFLLLLTSCNNEVKVVKAPQENDTLVDSKRIINTVNVTLISSAKKEIDNWQEYQNLDEFLIRYYNISHFEALDNANELSDLVSTLKDSLKIDKLNKKNVVARINVLKNGALRLADMSTIPTITNNEIEIEVNKIVELFDALNSKINTIYKAEELQKSLEIDTEIPIEIKEEKAVKVNPHKKIISSKSKTTNEKD